MTAQYDQEMKMLMIPYVIMTCWRSFFPNEYTERVCLWNNWMSSAFIGRLLATVGEICFVRQISLALSRANYEIGRLKEKDEHEDKEEKDETIHYIIECCSTQVFVLCTIA